MKYPKSLAITYEASLNQLSEGAKELFCILSWCAPDPIPRSLLDSSLNPVDEKRRLGEIERLHLARYLGDGTSFTIHRLNQEITREQQAKKIQPPALFKALLWIDSVFPDDPDEARNFVLLRSFAPHAQSLVTFGDAFSVLEPTPFLMVQLGLFLKTIAEFEQSENLYRRALAIYETHYGMFHPHVAIALNNLAQLLQGTNRLHEAEVLMRRALEIDERFYGSQHSNVGRDLNNLARVLQAKGAISEAEPLYRRALFIDEVTHGANHAFVATDLTNLATLLKASGRMSEAEMLQRRALAIDEAFHGADHPDVARDLNNLASVLQRTGHMREAEALIRRALAITEFNFGQAHPQLATVLNSLAVLLHATNRTVEAEQLLRRALTIDEGVYQADHPSIANRLCNLAMMRYANSHIEDAERMQRMGVLIFLQNSLKLEHPHSSLRCVIRNYALILHSLKGDHAMWPDMLSLAKDSGMTDAHLREILRDAFSD